MRALEWAVSRPERTDALLLLATAAAAGAEQIAWANVQVHAIRSDPHWRGGHYHHTGRGPHEGLGLARRIAHVTYRSEPELQVRFGRSPQDAEDPWRGGRYRVESYLDHHAAKLVHRFDAASHVVLSEAMNSHDVGRGRGGVRAALSRITAPTLVAGVDSDRLYPPCQQAELATGISTADHLRLIESPHGHDGFLIEGDWTSTAPPTCRAPIPTSRPARCRRPGTGSRSLSGPRRSPTSVGRSRGERLAVGAAEARRSPRARGPRGVLTPVRGAGTI